MAPAVGPNRCAMMLSAVRLDGSCCFEEPVDQPERDDPDDDAHGEGEVGEVRFRHLSSKRVAKDIICFCGA